MSALGDELRRLRRATRPRLTQVALARKLGIDAPSAISAWESGDREVSLDHWAPLAKALGVTTKHLEQFGQPYDPAARTTQRQRAAHAAPPLERQPLPASRHSATVQPSSETRDSIAASGRDDAVEERAMKELLFRIYQGLGPKGPLWLKRGLMEAHLDDEHLMTMPGKSTAGGGQ